MVLKIAHRGASRLAPENTIEAFKKALTLNSVDAVEFDVHRTKDGKIVVMHDHTLKRTTDCIGQIHNLNLQAIRKCHKPNGEPVPTLEEVLGILKGQCICKIDIKDMLIVRKIIAMVRKYKMEDSTIISSEIPEVLKKAKKIAPEIKLEAGGFGFRKKIPVGEIIKKAQEVQADIVSPHYSITTKELVDAAHKKGLEVHVWTVDDRETIQKMKKIGVDGITTNYPNRV